jgi:exonuclease SbcC
MKPIKLKMKGLNSFIDSQEINFEKLTDKGLFGIFGPTGSGKSTVLDGITLALYGEVARKSSNYMNTNCDTLNVSFEFQMSEKEIKRYRVDREFKREHKTGNVRSKSAKIIDITEEKEIILEEGTKNVVEKCEEIIGLKLEDFTRTVVLPQGKFSEFLKLEGKDRRNMLERLFSLQKYGDDLSIKLNNKIKEEKKRANILEGELKAYEDINEEIFEEKSKILSETKEKCSRCELEFKNAEENLNKGKELWELQNELKQQLDREKKIREKSEQIDESQRKVTLGESALKLKPYMDNYENTLKQIKTVEDRLLKLKNKVEIIKENKEKTENILEIAKYRKDKELPLLNIKEQKVIDAIEEKNVVNALIREKNLLENKITNIEKSLQNINNKIGESQNNISDINANIFIKEGRVETLKIPEEYKRKINEGILILNNYRNLSKQKDNLSRNIEIIVLNIEKAKIKSERLSKELKNKEKLLLSFDETLKKIVETCPGDQNTLLTLQERLSSIKDKWDKYKEYNVDLHQSKETVETLKKDLDDKEKEKVFIEQEINKISDNIKKIEIENLAHTLRESLLAGEVCPVCGSKDHVKDNVKIIDSSNLEELRINLNNKEKKESQLTVEIAKIQTKLLAEEKNIEDKQFKIGKLGEDFKSVSVEILQNEFDNLKVSINKFNTAKTDLEKKIKFLAEERSTLDVEYNKENTKLIENRCQFEKMQQDLKVSHEEIRKVNKELSVLKAELMVEDFISKREEISQNEEEKATLENEIKLLRDNLKSELSKSEVLSKELVDLREDFRDKKTTLVEKNKNIQEKEKAIKSKIGDIEDLESFKKEISESIKIIKLEYENAEKQKNEIDEKYSECNTYIIATQSEISSLKERSINDREKLGKGLIQEGIKSIDEAKSNLIGKTEIDKLKLQIEEHRDSLAKLAGNIEGLKKKIYNRSLTEEQWIKIQNVKNEKAKILETLNEMKIELQTEVKSIGERLVEKKKLLKSKKQLDYRLSLLDDLEKLFKGKKFVEFVAANQLKYVSVEASKRLKEITGGNYGLEVDENGKFLIRDYKNGGAKRDASTLSGGETFVTSLALALALSAQIQLKGTAPLELFFLDEGFGTLDDNLLEVVMDSLERIHNDRLSIGIISHVESIKSRVPIKLIVTAAEAGVGGSKVRLERS